MTNNAKTYAPGEMPALIPSTSFESQDIRVIRFIRNMADRAFFGGTDPSAAALEAGFTDPDVGEELWLRSEIRNAVDMCRAGQEPRFRLPTPEEVIGELILLARGKVNDYTVLSSGKVVIHPPSYSARNTALKSIISAYQGRTVRLVHEGTFASAEAHEKLGGRGRDALGRLSEDAIVALLQGTGDVCDDEGDAIDRMLAPPGGDVDPEDKDDQETNE